MSDYLYFDHAAATTVRPEAWEAVKALEAKALGNPSSPHTLGRKSRSIIDEARVALAPQFLVEPAEIIFTSGATESLHLAIIGAYLAENKSRGVIYTSPLVHSAVWAALDFLTQHHQAEVKLLPLSTSGHIDLENLTDQIIGESDLIITEHLNSEIGVMQPAAKLGKKLLRWADETKQKKPIFIVDAAASVVFELVGLEFFKCEALALSGEKFGGLSGAGLLLKSKDLPLESLTAGSQEWGYRGGSENVAGIAALSAAYLAHHQNLEAQKARFKGFETQIRSFLENLSLEITTPKEGSGCHILHFILPDTDAALFVAQADLAGLALSAGSACSSGSVEGSQTLKALGFSGDEAQRGVRISWGWDTTQKEVDGLCKRLEALLSTPS